MYPPEINDLGSGAGHEHPCLSPDNNRLFFWHTNVMMGDIYVSQKLNGVWQQAVPLPSPPNNWPPELAATAEADPCLAMDGRTLWLRKSFQLQDPYDYHIVVCVDTSDLAVGPRVQHPASGTKAALAVITDTSRALGLLISGAAVPHEQSVEVYDILGRLVGRYIVHFSTEGSSSRGVLPVLTLASGTYVVSIQLSTGTLSATFQSVD